jgi:CRISPR-associated endonuclease Csn1
MWPHDFIVCLHLGYQYNDYFTNRLKKDVKVTGFDVDVKISLSSYHKFNKIFKDRINNEPQNAELIRNLERVVLLGTIYSSPSDFAKRVKNNIQFKEFFKEDELEKISRLRFNGWGNFSRLLLAGYDSTSKTIAPNQSLTYKDEKTGNELSIIEIMREEPLNFNEVLYHEKYHFNDLIKRLNENKDETLDVDELIDSYYLSPAVKRSIKRTTKIVDELIQINDGIIPDKIFVEVTREDEAKRKGKGRTKSRLENLRAIYKNAIKDADEYRVLAKQLDNQSLDDAYLRPKKIYLYYLQNGKCAYSGEPLDLTKCDIDHIVPRSLVKDDSFNNLVLVKEEENKLKGDKYPIRMDVIRKQKPFWNQLRKNGLMSNEKYEKLTRTKELTDEDLQGFVNRQLVVTNQANKAVAEILKKLYGNATIVYSKASNVTDFRQQFNIIKGREINNVHHAHDAYLNIVVGNYFHTRFGSRYYYAKAKDKKWNPKKVFTYSISGCWDKERDISTIKKMLKRRDVLFTRMPEIRSGEFYDQNAIKANDGLIPIKEKGPLSDTSKYGGYSGKTAAYFTIVEHTIKNKRERILVSMPIIINQKIKQGHTTFIEYLENVLNLVEPSVLYSPIPFNTVFKRGQSLQYLTGSTGDFYQIIMRNMIEPYFDEFTFEYLCLIYKYFEQLEIRSNRKKMNENEMQSLKEIQVIFSSNEKRRQNENRLRFITLEKNKIVFENLIKQIAKPIYEKSFGKRRDIIISNKDQFYKLGLERQIEVISNLHRFIKSGVPGRIDLEELGVKSGNLTMNYKIEDLSIIKQSITGLYQKEIIIKQV